MVNFPQRLKINSMNDQKLQIVEKLKGANNILLTVSTNPSVDALAACIGLTLLLTKLNKHATAVFSGQVPSTIEFLKPEETIEKTTDSLRDFIISLDKSKADKLRYKVEDEVVKIFITPYRSSITEKDLIYSQGDFNVDVVLALGVQHQQDLDAAITAHGRILHDAIVISLNNAPNGELGSIHWQDLGASGLSEQAASLAAALDEKQLDEQIATAFLTGIVAETNHFGNQKTTPQTMTVSAMLLAAGANQQLVSTKLAPPPPAIPKPQPAPVVQPPKSPETAVDENGGLKITHDPNQKPGGQKNQGGKKGDRQQKQQPNNQNKNQSQNSSGGNQNQPARNQGQPKNAPTLAPPAPEPAPPAKPEEKKDDKEYLPAPAENSNTSEDSGSIDDMLKAADAELEQSMAASRPEAGPALTHEKRIEPLPTLDLPEPQPPLMETPTPAAPEAPAPELTIAPLTAPDATVETPQLPELPKDAAMPPFELTPVNTPAPAPDIIPPVPSTPSPALDNSDTLQHIEQTVHSPHAGEEPASTPVPEATPPAAEPAADVDSARKAVEDALKSTADAQVETPAAFNSMPVNLDLGHDPAAATPQPADPLLSSLDTPAPGAPDPFTAPAPEVIAPEPGSGQPAPAPAVTGGLPDYLQTPSLAPPMPPIAPTAPAVLPPNPAAGEPAPLNMSPADMPLTMPLPPTMNVPAPQAMPPTSTGLPPQGPPPPPVPPPITPL